MNDIEGEIPDHECLINAYATVPGYKIALIKRY